MWETLGGERGYLPNASKEEIQAKLHTTPGLEAVTPETVDRICQRFQKSTDITVDAPCASCCERKFLDPTDKINVLKVSDSRLFPLILNDEQRQKHLAIASRFRELQE